MMTKERVELGFIVLYRAILKLRSDQLAKLAEKAQAVAKSAAPVLVK